MQTRGAFKTALVLLMTSLLAVIGAACGGTQQGSSKVTVTFMTWETPQTNALIDTAMKKFMEQNPNIIVQRIATPNSDYGQKLASLVVAKKLPDIFWAGNDTEQQYGGEGLLYDWTNQANATRTSSFDISKFAPASIENWKVNGKLYGLPTLMNTYGIWYNADLFQQANLPLPKAGWSVQEMLHDAQVLTQKQGDKVTRYGLYGPPDGVFDLGRYSVSGGGVPFEDKLVNPTQVTVSPQFMEGLNLFINATKQGSVSPPAYPLTNPEESFIAGKLPMLNFGQWLVPSFIQAKPSFKYGFAPLPIVKDNVQPYDAVGICSPSYIQNPDAVWKVSQFLASTVWQTVLPGSPVAPAAYLPASTPYFDTLKNDQLSSVADSVQYELTAPTKTGIRFIAPWSTKANDILTANWDNILLGKAAPEPTVQKVVQQINDVIKQGS